MPILSAQGLTKSFGGAPVLDDVTLTIVTGERVGLVGDNGAGKSTLGRILAGLDVPDEGSVARRRGAEIEYLPQDPIFDLDRTVRQEVTMGLGGWLAAKERYDAAVDALEKKTGPDEALLAEQALATADLERAGGWEVMHRVEAILTRVGLGDPDRPIRELSGGDRRRVALCRILVSRPALAILDEPSNHLDVETIEWLEDYLIDEYPGALLLITHDRYLLDRVANRTLEIHRGKVESFDGGYGAYLEAKAARDELAQRTEQNRQNFLRRELEWLRRQPKARTGKQKARIDRAEAAKAARPAPARRALSLRADAVRSGKTVLELTGVWVEVAGKTLVRDLDLILEPGERLGVVGRNGTGKTSLLRVILGQREPAKGTVVLGKNTRIAYFDQHREELRPEASILDNVADGRSRIDFAGASIEIPSYLERFLFDRQRQRTPVGSLSGGERARVALAKMLSTPANLVLLDEPTNDLDVTTLGALEELLLEFPGTVITVTHDRYFLNRVATSLLSFEPEGRVVRYAGNYDDYLLQRPARPEPVKERAPRPAESLVSSEPASGAPEAKPLTFAERRELETLLDRIDEAEQRLVALQSAMADPKSYEGGSAKDLVARADAAREEVHALTARWEDLESRRDVTTRGRPRAGR